MTEEQLKQGMKKLMLCSGVVFSSPRTEGTIDPAILDDLTDLAVRFAREQTVKELVDFAPFISANAQDHLAMRLKVLQMKKPSGKAENTFKEATK